MKLWKKIGIILGATLLVAALSVAAVVVNVMCNMRTVSPEESAQLMEEFRKQGPDPDYEPSKQRAHPISRKLMKENFFWDILDDNAPFGNDDGAEALPYWRKWRRANPHGKIMEFMKDIFEHYDISFSDWERKSGNFAPFDFVGILTTSMGNNVVIATAFGQLMDEGYVDPELATLARKAIANEKNMVMVKRWSDPAQREARLAILESVLNKAPQVAPQSVTE